MRGVRWLHRRVRRFGDVVADVLDDHDELDAAVLAFASACIDCNCLAPGSRAARLGNGNHADARLTRPGAYVQFAGGGRSEFLGLR
jgi:hypothetical protein